MTVTFGGIPATSFTLELGSKITAIVPARRPTAPPPTSVVSDRQRRTTSTCSAIRRDDIYTYTWQPPTVSGLGLIPVTGTTRPATSSPSPRRAPGRPASRSPSPASPTVSPPASTRSSTGGTGSFTISFAGAPPGPAPASCPRPWPAPSDRWPVGLGRHHRHRLRRRAGRRLRCQPGDVVRRRLGHPDHGRRPGSTGCAAARRHHRDQPDTPTSSTRRPLSDTFSYVGDPDRDRAHDHGQPGRRPDRRWDPGDHRRHQLQRRDRGGLRHDTGHLLPGQRARLDHGGRPAGTGTVDVTVTTGLGTIGQSARPTSTPTTRRWRPLPARRRTPTRPAPTVPVTGHQPDRHDA